MMAKDALAVPQSNKCVSAGSPLLGQGRGPPSGQAVGDPQKAGRLESVPRPAGVKAGGGPVTEPQEGWHRHSRETGRSPHTLPHASLTGCERRCRLGSPISIASPTLKTRGGHLQSK